MRRLNVLMSAYACEPGKGSEPGVGWTFAVEMARHHNLWVITRANNRAVIEAELSLRPQPNIHFLYWDLPRWLRFWKRGGRRGVHAYYYLWQLGIFFVARATAARVRFDLVHHVTFARYWAPSFLCLLGIPLVWGPVGGGESAPRSFWQGAASDSFLYEARRVIARWIGEHGPFVRATARRSALALASTEETAHRLRALGSRQVTVFSQVGLTDRECERLGRLEDRPPSRLRFISVGELEHWKGYAIALAAFARASLEGSEYWLIGDGRERQRLERLAARLGVADRVKFHGKTARETVFRRLQECDVLLHPVLHDSAGYASLEAMAAGLPVICLDLGGPRVQVTPESGFRIPARTPDQAIRDIAGAMLELSHDAELRRRLGRGARDRIDRTFRWSVKTQQLNSLYEAVRMAGDQPAFGWAAPPSRSRTAFE